MDFESLNTICVIGWGKTSVALAELLLSLNKKVKVSEKKKKSFFPQPLIKDFTEKGVDFEFGKHSFEFIGSSELIIISPGVDAAGSSLAGILRQSRVSWMGELEFAFRLAKSKVIAITGTNGKSTTAYLAYRLLKEAGKKVYLGGNIGRPFSDFVLAAKKNDLIVLETSSFQLETVFKFRPHVAAFLNIEPDHLNRHKKFDNYFKAKIKIFKNQRKDDWAVVNRKDSRFKPLISNINSRIRYFGGEFPNDNFSCVYRIGQIFNISRASCLSLFSRYKGLPHRQQAVANLKGIKFVNDSKATNPASTLNALSCLHSPFILIAGGRDKNFRYSVISQQRRKIKKINLIGEAAEKIERDIGGRIKCQKFASLDEAVFSSYRDACPGDTVLFSPMCSSFDMFSGYQERGRRFTEIVNSFS